MDSSAPVARGQPYPQPQGSSRKPLLQDEHSPLYITSFVRECFTEDLCEVDFTQALTAMDHLRILEDRRRRELSAAIRRLGTNPVALEQDRQGLQSSAPGIADWIASTETVSKKVEALYTQVYIGLRRWTLINEMRLSPFNKPNCIAMLNNLYPPSYGSQPTIQLTENVLNAQRNAFFRYIQAVEKNGKEILINLENASRRPGDANGWPVVKDIVDVYLRKANAVIENCMGVKGPEDFEAVIKDKRTDSGVSFGSDLERKPVLERQPILEIRPTLGPRPSTSIGSSAASSDSEKNFTVRRPEMGERKVSIGTFERIARELRRIKSRSADGKENTDGSAKRPSVRQRPSLRKMRSTSGLLSSENANKKDGKRSRDNSSDRSGAAAIIATSTTGLNMSTSVGSTANIPFQYTIDEAQRERLLREAQRQRENASAKPKRNISPSQFAPSPMSSSAIRPRTAGERNKAPTLSLPQEEESSPTSCRINRLDALDPYRLPDLMLPELAA